MYFHPFPFHNFKTGYTKNPIAIPFAILDVNGIPTKIKNAGNASSNSFQLISRILCAIKLPTIINEGAVIAATLDKEAITGLKNAVIIVRPTTTIPVNPVLPPAAIPADDSIVAAVGLVPKIEPVVPPIASAINALPKRFSVLSVIKPACLIKPSNAPVVSNNSTSKMKIQRHIIRIQLHLKRR